MTSDADWAILKDLLTPDMFPPNFCLTSTTPRVVDVLHFSDKLFFSLVPQTHEDYSEIRDNCQNAWKSISQFIKGVGTESLGKIDTFMESLMTYVTTHEFTNCQVLDELDYAKQFLFRTHKDHEPRCRALLCVDESLIEAINHLPTMGEGYKSLLLEGVCGSIISEARLRVPLPSTKGSHAISTNFCVPEVCTQTFKDLCDCVNFREVIFEWIRRSEQINECWMPLISSRHKSLCITTVEVTLPVHNNRKPHEMFNFAERDCTISTPIDFTIDLCASHNIISVETLSLLTNDQGGRICVFQHPNYDRPRIAMNYPVDCSTQLYTYHCRLFISAQGSANFELMDFFVILGATNTISATSHAGMRLFEACFPRSTDSTTEIDGKELLEGAKVPDNDELNFSGECDLETFWPNYVETANIFEGDVFSESMNRPDRVRQFRPIRYGGIIPKGTNRLKSPSIPTVSHHMMLLSYDTDVGKFYGEPEEFCYDNATSIPIIPALLALKYKLPFKKIDEAIVMSMGFENMRYMARNFCIAHISLPGSKEARVIPMMISDALDLKVLLIPISLANSSMITEYLNGHLSVTYLL